MVNPVDATQQLLGLGSPASGADPAKAEAGRTFTLALLAAGKSGCVCDSCRFLQELSTYMLSTARSPFQNGTDVATSPAAEQPAPPAAAPAAGDPPPAPAQPPPAPPPQPQSYA